MGYQEIYRQANEATEERLGLAVERIREIRRETGLTGTLQDYFSSAAAFCSELADIYQKKQNGSLEKCTIEELAQQNEALYAEIAEKELYEKSYADPAFAVRQLGELGNVLSLVYAHLRSNIRSAFLGNGQRLAIAFELLIELYNRMENREEPAAERDIKADVYSYFHDYSELFEEENIRRLIDEREDFETQIVMESNLSDLRYLYFYGAYIGDNERKTAAFLNTLSEEEIKKMADTYTEGYRIGFEVTGKDLKKKKTAQIRYPIGFERMVRQAVINLRQIGLKVTMSAGSVSPNQQYDYDHKEDRAYYFDKAYVERCLEVKRTYFEENKKKAGEHAGPAVIEVFGEKPFAPRQKKEAIRYNEKQQKLRVYEMSMAGQLTNQYIRGEERSFTIIAFPIPEIGEKYPEIFRETLKINTLDYKLYRDMQQQMIDVLDTAERVHITGKGENKTDLYVKIYPLRNREKETAFENCVADVNIPVGEVFTSPVLKGTEGKLFVSQVYLNGLRFENLEIDFVDGRTTSYTCSNFEKEEENKKYIRDNVLMHHEMLPMGEFAIGTNTTAYRMARDYQIADKLPILIAEKTGPHFAVGDTCYSHEEELVTYNPDGKAIVARTNEISVQYQTDMEHAYFNCHTDITIPYDELDKVTVLRADGSSEDIIADGRFVLPRTEELNRPFDE